MGNHSPTRFLYSTLVPSSVIGYVDLGVLEWPKWFSRNKLGSGLGRPHWATRFALCAPTEINELHLAIEMLSSQSQLHRRHVPRGTTITAFTPNVRKTGWPRAPRRSDHSPRRHWSDAQQFHRDRHAGAQTPEQPQGCPRRAEQQHRTSAQPASSPHDPPIPRWEVAMSGQLRAENSLSCSETPPTSRATQAAPIEWAVQETQHRNQGRAEWCRLEVESQEIETPRSAGAQSPLDLEWP